MASGISLGATALLLAGCSTADQEQIKRLALPEPATKEGLLVQPFWDWMWAAAAVVGFLLWGLMAWVSFRFRRRSDDEVPVQVRYHLPLEVFYTVVPIVMCLAIFYWTVKIQNEVLPSDPPPADETITVVGQQWSWVFQYNDGPQGSTVFDSGNGGKVPTLWLPVDESIKVNLRSPDVIHSFWVPVFLFKMDIIPGRDNHFTFTPNKVGDFKGKCAELCGAYHSSMIFNVKVVEPAEYQAHLQRLYSEGQTLKHGYNAYQESITGLQQGSDK